MSKNPQTKSKVELHDEDWAWEEGGLSANDSQQ